MRLPSCHLHCRLKAEEEGEVEAVEQVAVEEEEEEVAVERAAAEEEAEVEVEAGIGEVEAGIGGGKQPNPTVAFDGFSYEHVAAMLA